MTAEPFTLDRFLACPRVAGLALSPDGSRLVASVATIGPQGTRYRTAVHEIDPEGSAAPRRLTRSAPGESSATFAPDGSLLFTSARPDPDAKEEREETPALWLLPAAGGEARLLAAPPGGVGGFAVARDSGTVVLAAGTHPGADGWEADEARAKAREEAGVTAQLFTGFPIRFWDTYLGPRETHLYAAEPAQGEARVQPRDLAPDAGSALSRCEFDITADGRTVLATWSRDMADPQRLASDLVAIDVATGDRRTLASGEGVQFNAPACSPDGRFAASIRRDPGNPDEPDDSVLVLVDLDSSEVRELTAGLDRWPTSAVWSPDSAAVYFVADDHGHTLPFRADIASGEITRLAAEGSFSDLCPAPDGERLYALRATVAHPARAVALDSASADQIPTELPTPGDDLVGAGTVERVTATAADGAEIGSWLVTPPGDNGPAPLVVFIHGGPLGTWSGWSWRWNPHLLAAQGYAVLMPDPALSTGYGRSFVARGRGRWGQEPYTDLMAAVDAAVARDDIDAERTAAMGGSFGGYMANWVAGHTDRFRCIVTHASLWSLKPFHGTTDMGPFWEREFGDPYTDPSRYLDNSPDAHIGQIRTPMLVIHGEKDFRVPIGEALKLWTDLARHEVDAQFLYFPDENHWILKPQNARLWYQSVLAFLDHHVCGKPWSRPELL